MWQGQRKSIVDHPLYESTKVPGANKASVNTRVNIPLSNEASLSKQHPFRHLDPEAPVLVGDKLNAV